MSAGTNGKMIGRDFNTTNWPTLVNAAASGQGMPMQSGAVMNPQPQATQGQTTQAPMSLYQLLMQNMNGQQGASK